MTEPGINIDNVIVAADMSAQFIFLSDDGSDIHRQDGFSGPEASFWATGAPTGALGGDDTDRQFGFFTDGMIHEYDPFTDTDTFINGFAPPAADIEGLAFDGTHLFAGTASGDLYTLDPDTGDVINVVAIEGGGLFGLGVSGDVVGEPVNGLLGQYYLPGGTVSDFPDFDALSPVHERIDPAVDFPAVGSDFGGFTDLDDDFAVRWTGQINITAPGQVIFFTESDDGSRLFVNDQLVVDNGGLHSMQERSGAVTLAAGLHDLEMHFFERMGGAGAILRYDPADGDKQVIPTEVLLSPGSGPLLLPDIDEYTVDLTGKAGEPIDIILDGHHSADFSGELLELLDTDGETVLATATSDPLGAPASNFDLAILDFIVPADGVYTVRVTSNVQGQYGLVVTDPLTFDSEPNSNLVGDPLRSLDETEQAIGWLAGSGVDLYEVTLTAGQIVTVSTETPYDNDFASPLNSLNPQVAVFDPSGTPIASDTDSLDGKNAMLDFTAGQDGTYTVQVGVESGQGEYVLHVDVPTMVEQVLVADADWDPAFLTYLDSQNLGDDGFAIPAGADQSLTLPWTGLDQVKIVFSEHVEVVQSDLQVRGVDVANYVINGFDYHKPTHTATWSFASPIGADNILIDLADTVADADGGGALDGDWTNGVGGNYPSGDGAPGGAFQFRLSVLPGDVSRDGVVNITDVVQTRNRQGTAAGQPTYTPLHDLNGDAAINVSDVVQVRNRQGTASPAGEPSAPARLPVRSAPLLIGAVGLPVLRLPTFASINLSPVDGEGDKINVAADDAVAPLTGRVRYQWLASR